MKTRKTSSTIKKRNRRLRRPFFPKDTADSTAFFQPKTKVDSPHSAAEKEADAVAEQVVNQQVQGRVEEEETAAFLLGGDNLEKRIKVQEKFR